MLSIMKKILLSLFVWLIWLLNFWYCDLLTTELSNWTFTQWTNVVLYQSLSPWKSYCISINRSSCMFTQISYISIWVPWWNWANYNVVTPQWWTVSLWKYLCFYNYVNNWTNLIVTTNWQWSCTNSYSLLEVWNFTDWSSSCPDCPVCDDPYTSLECQTEYSLIPISTVDENYCVDNLLCPSSDCSVCPWSWDNWSALYINDIQHLGKPIINITFPDYLDWDYTSTWDIFNLDIVWYPVDTEYIDWIIRTQNYKPTSEDFTQLVWMLAPYSKYLLFLLFIFIIWAWIKKPFKSKKL